MLGINLPESISFTFQLTQESQYIIIFIGVMVLLLLVVFCTSLILNLYFIFKKIKYNKK